MRRVDSKLKNPERRASKSKIPFYEETGDTIEVKDVDEARTPMVKKSTSILKDVGEEKGNNSKRKEVGKEIRLERLDLDSQIITTAFRPLERKKTKMAFKDIFE